MFFKYTTHTCACAHAHTCTLVRTQTTHYLLKTYIIIVCKTDIYLYIRYITLIIAEPLGQNY